ncbi:MAG: hypothetical protein Q8J65_05675 [Nitrosomonadales bacterium]|nr:hypothetical protein [Nitrosomonadales bacterium]
MEYPALIFLVIHGLLGGIDVLFNHEFKEHLPDNPAAKSEVFLHSLREASFAIIFLSLAWFQWKGFWCYFIAAVLLIEIIITSIDALVEDRVRTLSAFERVVHILLFINTGIYIALLAPVLLEWQAQANTVSFIYHGWPSVLLSLLGLFAIAWTVRDALSYRKLKFIA